MEFEDMKKIWDTQNDRPLFAIDEGALLRRVLKKKNKAARWANWNEWGLIIINVSIIGLIALGILEHMTTFYRIAIPLVLAFGVSYVIYLRDRRQRERQQFDRTLLGELDHAIANVRYLERMSRTMVWWYIIPLVLPLFVNMFFFQDGDRLGWKLTVVTVGLILSVALTRWEARRLHGPRRKELESLRQTLVNSD